MRRELCKSRLAKAACAIAVGALQRVRGVPQQKSTGTSTSTSLSRFKQAAIWCLVLSAFATWQAPTMDGQVVFHDWSATSSNSGTIFTNTSSAGTVTSNLAPFGAASGTWGVPTAITSQLFTNEFNVGALGASITFGFSNNYAWGTGGQMLLGNIHNYFQYTISAWDFGNNAIDVNTWTTPAGLLAEYPNSAPGTLGYFSTSATTRTAADIGGLANLLGLSSNFAVVDPLADANSGQGGVLALGGLTNVGKIQLQLTSKSLGVNAEQGDFFLFNVATPTTVPEPSAYAMVGVGLLGLFLVRKQRKHA